MTTELELGEIQRKLPRAVWVPSGSHRIYRGAPVEIVQDMAGQLQTGLTFRQALTRLVSELEASREIRIELPWEEEDAVLSSLFLYALLDLGIGYEVGEA